VVDLNKVLLSIWASSKNLIIQENSLGTGNEYSIRLVSIAGYQQKENLVNNLLSIFERSKSTEPISSESISS
jgi:hypothetical protein